MATRYDTHHLHTVSSTQDEARGLFAGTPVLVTADRQVAGRGRSGSEWAQANRAVFASLALRPGWPVGTWPRLGLAASLAAREALGDHVGLKWPNDLMVGGNKVGGLLAESSASIVVIGIGINLWWGDPPQGMAGLLNSDPGAAAASEIADHWARLVMARQERSSEDWGVEEYRAACVTLGSEIEWDPDGRGRAVGVAVDGALIVETSDGMVTITSGAVRHVRDVG